MGGIELVVTLHGRGRACPARRFAWADVCGWLPRGWPLAEGFAGRRGRRPLRFAREWAAAGASPSSGPAGPPSPKGEGKGCCWRRRKVSRGVEDAAPCGLPGNGRQREPAPHPALRGHLPPRGKARVVVGGGARFRGVSGTPPSTGCPKSICAKQKATTCFSDGRFYFACYRLSIIFATISVAVLTYSVMLNCLTTSTS